jgi:hypothetical protein
MTHLPPELLVPNDAPIIPAPEGKRIRRERHRDTAHERGRNPGDTLRITAAMDR